MIPIIDTTHIRTQSADMYRERYTMYTTSNRMNTITFIPLFNIVMQLFSDEVASSSRYKASKSRFKSQNRRKSTSILQEILGRSLVVERLICYLQIPCL